MHRTVDVSIALPVPQLGWLDEISLLRVAHAVAESGWSGEISVCSLGASETYLVRDGVIGLDRRVLQRDLERLRAFCCASDGRFALRPGRPSASALHALGPMLSIARDAGLERLTRAEANRRLGPTEALYPVLGHAAAQPGVRPAVHEALRRLCDDASTVGALLEAAPDELRGAMARLLCVAAETGLVLPSHRAAPGVTLFVRYVTSTSTRAGRDRAGTSHHA